MTERERLIELIKDIEYHPEKTCVNYAVDDRDICANCPYDKGSECDMVVRKADYLIKNGIILPPCKVGDILYTTDGCTNRPEKIVVTSIRIREKYTLITALSRGQREYVYEKEDFGKIVFFTKEEAKQALRKEDEGK